MLHILGLLCWVVKEMATHVSFVVYCGRSSILIYYDISCRIRQHERYVLFSFVVTVIALMQMHYVV